MRGIKSVPPKKRRTTETGEVAIPRRLERSVLPDERVEQAGLRAVAQSLLRQVAAHQLGVVIAHVPETTNEDCCVWNGDIGDVNNTMRDFCTTAMMKETPEQEHRLMIQGRGDRLLSLFREGKCWKERTSHPSLGHKNRFPL